jgi:hypothetical protein
MATGVERWPLGILYPVRNQDFVNQYIRTLNRYCVAETIGTDAFAVLIIVLDAESRRDFKSPPRFLLYQFADRLGLSPRTASKAVRTAVNAGWLHQENVGDRFVKASWVTVPDHCPLGEDRPK